MRPPLDPPLKYDQDDDDTDDHVDDDDEGDDNNDDNDDDNDDDDDNDVLIIMIIMKMRISPINNNDSIPVSTTSTKMFSAVGFLKGMMREVFDPRVALTLTGSRGVGVRPVPDAMNTQSPSWKEIKKHGMLQQKACQISVQIDFDMK